MPTIRKVRAGAIAKRNGQIFENLIQSSASRQGWKVTQIPMGAKQISSQRMIRVRTPFDMILWKNGSAMALDAKSTSAKTFSKSNITPHQLLNLSQIEAHHFVAGYLVYFSELNKVCFYSATKLMRLRSRQSLTPEDGVCIGSISKMDFDLISVLEHPLLNPEPHPPQT